MGLINVQQTSGTDKQYQLAWNTFIKWFNMQGFGDSIVSSTRVVNFLMEQFDSLAVSFIVALQTAISSTAPPYDRILLDQSPLVFQCIKQMEQLQLSLSAYNSI